jgi:hypothetical protein
MTRTTADGRATLPGLGIGRRDPAAALHPQPETRRVQPAHAVAHGHARDVRHRQLADSHVRVGCRRGGGIEASSSRTTFRGSSAALAPAAAPAATYMSGGRQAAGRGLRHVRPVQWRVPRRQCGFQRRPCHRCSRGTAVILTLRLVQLDDDHQLRIVRREEPGKGRIVRTLPVPPARCDPDRPGLAGHGERAERRRAARTILHGAGQHIPQLFRHLGRNHPAHRSRCHARIHTAVPGAHLPYQPRLQERATVRQDAVGHGHLEWRNRHLVADGQARRRLPRPLRRPAQQPARFRRVCHTRG